MPPASDGGIPGFYLSREQAGDVPVLCVGGELDLHAAPDLRGAFDQLIGEDVPGLVLDLTESTFIDSTALGAIAGAHRRLGEGRLAIVCTNEHVLRIFGYARMDELLSIHEKREDALASLR